MNRRAWTWPLFALFLTLIIGLHCYLGRYAHPMADDFSYALKDASGGACSAAAWEYSHWNGRYASNLLVLFGPLRGGFAAIHVYRAVPTLLFILTFFGAFFLVRTLGGPSLPISYAALAALTWTALYAHLMPDMPEGFFWYTGAVTYQLPNALTLIACAMLLRAIRDRSIPAAVAVVLLLFFITGCNEVLMLLLVVSALLLVSRSIFAARRTSWVMWSAMLTVAIGAALVILAPGNEGRSAFFPERHRMMTSLWMSTLQTARFSLEWVTCPALLLLSMAWWLNHRRLAQREPLLAYGFGIGPWVSLPLLFGTIFLCVFPAYWSTGILGQHRTANVACFFFLPLWFVNLSVFAARSAGDRLRLHDRDRHRVTAALLLLTSLDIAFTGNSSEAIADLFSGHARRADEQLWRRYDLLRVAGSSPDGIAVVPLIHDPPRSIYVLDLRTPEFLVNQDYAAWFGLKEVRIAAQSDAANVTN